MTSWSIRFAVAIRRLAAIILLSGLVAGCASQQAHEVNDPFEVVNRQVFAFNDAVDTMVVRPVAVVYRDFMPRPFKTMIGNLVDHLTLPLTTIHDLLQGKPEQAQIAFSRFFINTVVGVGGLFDIATPHGLKHHREDMGQTLAVHGSGPGPYLVLPFFGPSNLRDGIGDLIDRVIDPVNVVAHAASDSTTAFRVTRAGATVVVQREALLEPIDVLKQSLDYYAAVRSAYAQRRHSQILDGKVDAPDLSTDPFATAEQADAQRLLSQ